MTLPSIGIVGVGVVGGALLRWFRSQGHAVFAFDPLKGIGSAEDLGRSEVVFVAVPTPFDEVGGFDGSAVAEAVASVPGSKTVVIKSTVLPGTTESLQSRHPSHRLLFSPEFLTESTADEDVARPMLNIVGYTEASRPVAPGVLALFAPAPFEKILPSREAEFFKYFRNAFFATKVVFSNQMYDLCRKLGLDYEAVRDLAAHDPWIGGAHTAVWHKGYRGYGGKCLPKDVRAFIRFSREQGADQKLLETVEVINAHLTAIPPRDDSESSGARPAHAAHPARISE